MKGWITSNIGYKLISLCFAASIWFVVANEPELSTFVSVPVQYQNLPDDLEILSDAVESVSLEMRGPSGQLRDFSASKGAVVLDMSGIRAGERTFSVSQDNVDLPRGVRLIRAIPAQVRLAFEKQETREVPVKVRFAGGPHPGYEVAGFQVRPQALVVTGPETRVRRMEAALTDPIDISSAVSTSEYRVNAFVPDPRLRFQSKPQVAVRVEIRKK